MRPSAVLERAVDAAILVCLVVVAIRTPGSGVRTVALIGIVLMLFAWFIAWRRR